MNGYASWILSSAASVELAAIVALAAILFRTRERLVRLEGRINGYLDHRTNT